MIIRTNSIRSVAFVASESLILHSCNELFNRFRPLFTDFRLIHATIDFPFAIHESQTFAYIEKLCLLLPYMIEFDWVSRFLSFIIYSFVILVLKKIYGKVNFFYVAFHTSNGTAGDARVIARTRQQNNWGTVYVGLRIHKILRS